MINATYEYKGFSENSRVCRSPKSEFGMTLEVPEGVQAFNLWTVTVMARLWDEFPQPQYFCSSPTVVSVTSNSRQAGTPIGPQGVEQVRYFTDTLRWLIDEGFARGMARAGGDFAGVVLSRKGFSILDEVPRALASKPEAAPEKKLGTLMREVAVTQIAALAAALVERMLGIESKPAQ